MARYAEHLGGARKTIASGCADRVQRERRGSDVAAVVFEGFTAGDDAGNAVNTLLSSGINAISCSRGEFSDAVSRMERGVGAGQSTSAAPVPACEPAATEVEELAA